MLLFIEVTSVVRDTVELSCIRMTLGTSSDLQTKCSIAHIYKYICVSRHLICIYGNSTAAAAAAVDGDWRLLPRPMH